jgi:hypothetical protein
MRRIGFSGNILACTDCVVADATTAGLAGPPTLCLTGGSGFALGDFCFGGIPVYRPIPRILLDTLRSTISLPLSVSVAWIERPFFFSRIHFRLMDFIARRSGHSDILML